VDTLGKAPLLSDSAQDEAGGTSAEDAAATDEGAADARGAGQTSVAIRRRATARRKLAPRL
jgi:hypothetical protein